MDVISSRRLSSFLALLFLPVFFFSPQAATGKDLSKKENAQKSEAAAKAQAAAVKPQPAVTSPDARQAASQAAEPEYVIGTEDVLEISIWKSPDLSKTVTVRPDGMITLPLIGDLQAAGLTPSKLKANITERLKEYQDPVIASVIVQEVRSYRIYVLGEVLNPGTYTVTRNTSLLQAIALAGGFSPFASRGKMVLVREGDRGGRPEKRKIDFDDIVDSSEKKDGNLILRPGDTIFVP